MYTVHTFLMSIRFIVLGSRVRRNQLLNKNFSSNSKQQDQTLRENLKNEEQIKFLDEEMKQELRKQKRERIKNVCTQKINNKQ